MEAIYKLEEKEGAAKTSELASELHVALGTITNTIESMEKQSLITHRPYKGVKLTAKGRRIALDVVRRHRLAERLLTDVLRLEWGKAHDVACKLEHAFSDKEVIKALERALGNPKTCPHGNPIPSDSGKMKSEEAQVLSDLTKGEEATIVKITDERKDVLHYLASLGLVPGALVSIQEKAPFDGPITVKVNEANHALGLNIAAVVWVKKA